MTRRRLVSRWIELCALLAGLAAAAAPPPDSLSVLGYNVNNYMPGSDKPAAAAAAVADVIATCRPDIMVLCEMGPDPALAHLRDELAQRGADYPFSSLVQAADEARHLAVLARFEPLAVAHRTNAVYHIGDETVPVRRGFGHCLFGFDNGYRLHVVMAHLKSKLFSKLGQSDMRRYEARQLRYFVEELLDEDAEANILVLGDMNDTSDTSAIRTIVDRRGQQAQRLYDLRPVDDRQSAWTHMWAANDSYQRIDYAFASIGLVPEIDFGATGIPYSALWHRASDHRPLLISVRPSEQRDDRVFARFESYVYHGPSASVPPLGGGTIYPSRKVQRNE